MDTMIEREAKLFEAGSYPDRGVEFTEEDLDRIAAGTRDAPVRIEHSATPFDGALGVLRSVFRRGSELFGRLAFYPAAWQLIRQAGAQRLSVAIRADKTAIAEVSLVREPRIADAAVFGGADLLRLESAENLSMHDAAGFSDPETDRLRAELSEQRARQVLDSLKREGKVVPASETFALALLRCGEDNTLTFGDRPTPVARLFEWFLQSQPKVIEFAELAPARPDDEEPELFAKLGVTRAQVDRWRDPAP